MDFNPAQSWEEPRTPALRTPRFAIGAPDPRLGLPGQQVFEPALVLHNFSAHELPVNLSVGFRPEGSGAEGPLEIQIPLALSPGQTRHLNLRQELGAQVPEGVHWGWLELSYTARYNALAAALVSVTQDGEHSLRSVLNWVQGSASDGWYWRADATRNTLIGILNADTEEARVQVSLDYYSGGQKRSYELPELLIPARAAELVDVAAVQASAQPDGDGDVLPAEVSVGGYKVRKVGPRLARPLITEALVVDLQRKSFETFYNTCCALSSPKVEPTSLLLSLSTSKKLKVTALALCTGTRIEVTDSATFLSFNTGVATTGPTAGNVNGVGVGSTQAHTDLEYYRYQSFVDPCALANFADDTDTDVNPTVTIPSCTKQHLALGPTAPSSTKTGSCSATGNPPGGAYAWSPTASAITVSGGGAPSTNYFAAAEGQGRVRVTYTVNNRSATKDSGQSPFTSPPRWQSTLTQLTRQARPATLHA